MFVVLQDFESLAQIARERGLASANAIFEHPKNQALRELRPDAEAVYPGDLVFIPEDTTVELSPGGSIDTRRWQQWFKVQISHPRGGTLHFSIAGSGYVAELAFGAEGCPPVDPPPLPARSKRLQWPVREPGWYFLKIEGNAGFSELSLRFEPAAGADSRDPAGPTEQPAGPPRKHFLEVRCFDLWGNPGAHTWARLLRGEQEISGEQREQAMRFPAALGRYLLLVDSRNLSALVVPFTVRPHPTRPGLLQYVGIPARLRRPQGSHLRRTTRVGRRRASEVREVVDSFDVFLRDPWFVDASTPPRDSCKVTVLVDGEEAWQNVAAELTAARSRIHITTWMYQASAELLRPPGQALASPSSRRHNTVHEMLLRSPARKRLLLFNWPAVTDWSTSDERADAAGAQSNDAFEVMEQKNPTSIGLFWGSKPEYVVSASPFPSVPFMFNWGWLPLGSYHQKTITIDGRVGFVGGMNLKGNDWDTCEHKVYEPRRCNFERNSADRREVAEQRARPDNPPRHDFIARVEGPAVRDIDFNFQQRWDYCIDQKVRNHEHATPAPCGPAPGPAGSMRAQIVRTMPEPYQDKGILAAHKRAIRMARRMIYIEDQYFRSRELAAELREAKRRFPYLHIIALTPDPGTLAVGWTRECVQIVRETARDFAPMQLKVWDAAEEELQTVDIHAKLMIVDDLWCTVGSANLNDRGMDFEGEINVSFLDATSVKALRLRLFREHLANDSQLSGDIERDCQRFRQHVMQNAEAERRGRRPGSRVFPLDLGRDLLPDFLRLSPEVM